MNARAYFCILRPVRTVIFALLYGGFVWMWLWSLLRVPASERPFLVVAVIGPVILGSMFLGPLHEVMHRSFFPTLPGARQRLRRWHTLALAVASIVLVVPAAIFVGDIPRTALYGLIIAGLSLPVLNSRRRSWGLFRPQFLLLILAGIVLVLAGRYALIAICRQVPIGVLAVGVGIVFISFRIGFSKQRVRDRWRDPNLYCFQSMVPFLGTDVMLHAQAQNRQYAQENSRRQGRDWNVTSIGTSIREWGRVIHHARFGRGSRIRQLLGLAVTGAMQTPVCTAITYGLNKFAEGSKSSASFFQLLAEAGKVNGNMDHFHTSFLLTMPPIFVYGLALLAAMVASTPLGTFPISSQRLGNILFINALRQAAWVLVAYVIGTALCFFGASIYVGQPFELGMLAKPLAASAILPFAITLSLGIGFFRNAFWRCVASIVVILVTFISIIAVEADFAAYVISPVGLLGCAAATGLACWFTWLFIRRHYRACDLNNPSGWLKKLGLGIA